MKISLISLAAAAVLATGATPAVAATPGAPPTTAIEFKTDGPANGGVIQIRHRRGYGHTRLGRRCNFLRRTHTRQARRLYLRLCVGGHRVSHSQCRRWRHLGYRRGLVRYRHLFRRNCRWYR